MAATLVLCSETDLAALWAWRGLAALGGEPPVLVTAGLLTSALRWTHRVGEGAATVEIALADGRVLRSGEIGGVLNRLTHLPLRTAGASAVDRAYAEQEWGAFAVSWLHALPGPMLNRPSPLGLSGIERGPADWAALAAEAGLPVVAMRQTWPPAVAAPLMAGTRAFAVGGAFVGLPPGGEAWGAACRRFVAVTGCGLLGMDFTLGADGTWRLAGATTLPDLRAGGRPLLHALAAALRP